MGLSNPPADKQEISRNRCGMDPPWEFLLTHQFFSTEPDTAKPEGWRDKPRPLEEGRPFCLMDDTVVTETTRTQEAIMRDIVTSVARTRRYRAVALGMLAVQEEAQQDKLWQEMRAAKASRYWQLWEARNGHGA